MNDDWCKCKGCIYIDPNSKNGGKWWCEYYKDWEEPNEPKECEHFKDYRKYN